MFFMRVFVLIFGVRIFIFEKIIFSRDVYPLFVLGRFVILIFGKQHCKS